MNRFILLFLFCTSLVSAQNITDIYNNPEITFFGLDFSKAKMIGSKFSPDETGESIKLKFYKAWNDLMLNEADKYNVEKAFNKKTVRYSLDKAYEVNKNVPSDKVLILDDKFLAKELSMEEINSIVAQYGSKDKKGLGLILAINYFNKNAEEAGIYTIIFDIATSKILMVQKETQKPGGFGLRNYWASTIYNSMQHTRNSWKSWMKMEKSKK